MAIDYKKVKITLKVKDIPKTLKIRKLDHSDQYGIFVHDRILLVQAGTKRELLAYLQSHPDLLEKARKIDNGEK